MSDVQIRKDYIGTLTRCQPNGEDEILHHMGVESFSEDEALADAKYMFEEYVPELLHEEATVVTVVQGTIMEEGLKRNCSNCEYFDCNNDEEYAHEYDEGSDGNCIQGGGKDPIYEADSHQSELECDTFKADHMLVEMAETYITLTEEDVAGYKKLVEEARIMRAQNP